MYGAFLFYWVVYMEVRLGGADLFFGVWKICLKIPCVQCVRRGCKHICPTGTSLLPQLFKAFCKGGWID